MPSRVREFDGAKPDGRGGFASNLLLASTTEYDWQGQYAKMPRMLMIDPNKRIVLLNIDDSVDAPSAHLFLLSPMKVSSLFSEWMDL